MIKAIVYGYNMQEAENAYYKYCADNNIPCKLKDARLLSCSMKSKDIKDRIKGYLHAVESGEVKLIGWDKKRFLAYYYL